MVGAVNNWQKYFGTPKDAALTVFKAGGLPLMIDICGEDCPRYSASCAYFGDECQYKEFYAIYCWMTMEVQEQEKEVPRVCR